MSSVRYILRNEKYCGDLLLQKTLVEDFLTHKLVKNTGQLPQYFVEGAHAPIIPKSIFLRAADEMFLRWNDYVKGGSKFGSQKALKGRTYCACGQKMRCLRRNEFAFRCDLCGIVIGETELKKQVMTAVNALPSMQQKINARISQLPLLETDRVKRSRAMRTQWQLLNLTEPQNMPVSSPACFDEDDFRFRTANNYSEWSDDALIRILEKVVCKKSVHFRGGITVDL